MRLGKKLLVVIDQIVESEILGRDVSCQILLIAVFLLWVDILCALILWLYIYAVLFLLVGLTLLIMFAGNGNAVFNVVAVKLLR